MLDVKTMQCLMLRRLLGFKKPFNSNYCSLARSAIVVWLVDALTWIAKLLSVSIGYIPPFSWVFYFSSSLIFLWSFLFPSFLSPSSSISLSLSLSFSLIIDNSLSVLPIYSNQQYPFYLHLYLVLSSRSVSASEFLNSSLCFSVSLSYQLFLSFFLL